ncbi:MAG: hypothetical protein R3Y58_06610 [Eubacteriales bacterium]
MRKYIILLIYKGLESDVIILVDIDKSILLSSAINVFYVGTSRARLSLAMLAELTLDDCREILEYYGKVTLKKPKKMLSAFLNSKYCILE